MEGLKNKLNKVGIGKNKKTVLILLALIIIPIAVGLMAQDQNRRNSNKNPDVLAANEVNDILAKVGALMDLPNEEPTIATVSDVSKLKDQQFFAKAQNGDKVIIFPNAQKAILYRPSSNKIIEIALYTPPTVTPGGNAPSPEPTSVRSLQDIIGTSPTPTPGSTSTPTPSGSISPTPTAGP